MNRDAFLTRVRQAIQSGQRYPVHLSASPATRVGYCGGGDDLPARLAAEIVAVGGHAQVVDDLPAARAVLDSLIADWACRRVLAWQHPVLDALDLASLLAARGIELYDHRRLAELDPAEARRAMLAADLGITSAWYAVAETGSLAVAAAPGSERVASLLPPVHVAIVTGDQILPDLFDLFERVEPALGTLTSNLVLITGPSKTGDLELKLTTGVHGPGRWQVIVVRQWLGGVELA